MGNQTSQPPAAEPHYVDDLELRLAPHNFYLVFGKPPIRFARERARGPLIYDVQVDYDEDEDLVEHAATLDLTSAVPRRQKMELITSPAPSPGTVGGSKGLALSFQLAARVAPQRVRVYAGATVDYRVGEGLRLRCSGGVAAGSLCILDTTDTAGVTTVATNPLILPQQLQPLRCAEAPHHGTTSTAPRVTYAPLAIEVLIGDAEEPIKRPRRAAPTDKESSPGASPNSQSPASSPSRSATAAVSSVATATNTVAATRRIVQYTFLEAPEEVPESAGSPLRGVAAEAGRPVVRYTCKVAKQLVQVGTEVYELEDVFDDGREEDVRPHASDDDDDEEGLCVICLTNRKNTTILPCRHMCLCNECAAHLRLTNNRCPLCRGNIDRVMTL